MKFKPLKDWNFFEYVLSSFAITVIFFFIIEIFVGILGGLYYDSLMDFFYAFLFLIIAGIAFKYEGKIRMNIFVGGILVFFGNLIEIFVFNTSFFIIPYSSNFLGIFSLIFTFVGIVLVLNGFRGTLK